MAEEGGAGLGLAVLQIDVETGEALQKLDDFRQQVDQILKGAGDNLFRGLDNLASTSGTAAGTKFGESFRRAAESLISGITTPQPQAQGQGSRAQSRPALRTDAQGTTSAPSASALKPELRELTVAAENLGQIDRGIRSQLVRLPLRGPDVQTEAPRRLTLRSTQPDVLPTTVLSRGDTGEGSITKALRETQRHLALSDARLFRSIGENIANTKDLLSELGSNPPSSKQASSGRPALPPQERLNDIRAKLEALGPAPPKPSSERKRFGTRGIENADPAAVAAFEQERKAYESWNRKYLRLKKQEVAASNEAFEAERKLAQQRASAPLPPTVSRPPALPPPPPPPSLTGTTFLPREGVISQRRLPSVSVTPRVPSPPPPPVAPTPAPTTARAATAQPRPQEPQQRPPDLRGFASALQNSTSRLGAFEAACNAIADCLAEFLAACREASGVLSQLGQQKPAVATQQKAAAPKVEAPAPPKPKRLKFGSAAEALDFGSELELGGASERLRTVRQLREYRTALLQLRDASDLGEESTRRLTDRINLVSSRIDSGQRVGQDTVAGAPKRGAAESAASRERLLDEVSATRRRINRLPDQQQPQFREQLARVELEIEQRRLGTARQLSTELKRQTLDAAELTRGTTKSRPVEVRAPAAPAAPKTPAVKFSDVNEALAFKPQNTLRGLEAYQKALQALRLDLEASSRDAQLLNDRLNELAPTIQAAKTVGKDTVAGKTQGIQRESINARQSRETSLTNLRTQEFRFTDRVERLRSTSVPGLGRVDTKAADDFVARFRAAIDKGDLGLAKKLRAETNQALTDLETQLRQAKRDPRGFRTVGATPITPPVLRPKTPVQKGLEDQLSSAVRERGQLEQRLAQFPKNGNAIERLKLEIDTANAIERQIAAEQRLAAIERRRGRTAGVGGGGGAPPSRGGGPGSPPEGPDGPRRRQPLTFTQERGPSLGSRVFGNKRVQDALSSGLIGGAFPLLFGQGAGASIGGLAGGLGGGALGGGFGFGASLVGTAVGAQIDAAIQRLGTLGNALSDPVAKFGELSQAGLVSSSALQKNIEALIASGREAEASAQIQLDAARQFGDTSELTKLAEANTNLNQSFAQLSVVISKFAAGPLTSFFNGLSTVANAISQKSLTDERFKQQGVSTEEQNNIKAQALAATAADRQGLGVYEQSLILYREINKELDKRVGKTKDVVRLEALAKEAAGRQDALRSNSFRAVDAETFGNKGLSLRLERDRINLQRRQDIAAKPKITTEQRAAIDQKAALDEYRVTQQLAQLDRERYANNIISANKLRDIQEQISIETVRPRLTPIGTGALEAVKQLNDARRAAEDAQARAGAAPGDLGLANEAANAANQVELAGQKTRNYLFDAFRAAKEAVKNISQSIQDASLNLAKLRGSQTGGLNQFLSGQALFNNQQATLQGLLPQFEQSKAIAARDAELRGNTFAAQQFRGLQFSGPISGVIDSVTKFIEAQRTETRLQDQILGLRENLVKANNDFVVSSTALNETNAALAAIMPTVADAVNNLANKDWNVVVNVTNETPPVPILP